MAALRRGFVALALALTAAPAAFAAYPGANGQIAHEVAGPEGPTLRVSAPDGSDTRPFAPGSLLGDPSWSPGGDRLAADLGDGEGFAILSADGVLERRILGPYPAGEPSWAPDGERLAWQRECELAIVNPYANSAYDVTDMWDRFNGGDCVVDPAWWPKGNTIAFTRERCSFNPFGGPNPCERSIWKVRDDGLGLALVVPHEARAPAWSPDGTRLAFLGCQRGDPAPVATTCGIWLSGVDGRNRRLVGPGPVGESLAWSPDGRWIVFERPLASEGDAQLWLVDPATGQQRPLVRRTAAGAPVLDDATAPDWQPLR